MRITFALARAAAVLVVMALVLGFVPSPKVSSSTVELVTEAQGGGARALPLEMARHVREVILDRQTMERLSTENSTEASDRAVIETAARVEVVTLDGRAFHVVVRDPNAERATRVSNELAALAVARAAEVVARTCPDPGCRAKARVAEQASVISVPLEPERWLAIGFGLLLALAVAVVPLTVTNARERERSDEDLESSRTEEEKAPRTERLPHKAALSRTLPVDSAVPRQRPSTAPSPEFARTEVARAEPPDRNEAPAPPVTAEAATASPIMGYPAPTGWHADASLDPAAREELAAELRSRSADECVTFAISAASSELKAARAVEVALAAASPGDRRLLLVDADFRNPNVAALLHIEVPDAADFTSELARRVEGGGSGALSVLICTPTLHILPARPSHSGDLILTTHFETCLRMVRDYYDLVVVNGPLTSAGVYCTAIADVIDGLAIAGDAAIPDAFAKKTLVRKLPG